MKHSTGRRTYLPGAPFPTWCTISSRIIPFRADNRTVWNFGGRIEKIEETDNEEKTYPCGAAHVDGRYCFR